MADEPQRLIRRGRRLASALETLSASFARELAAVWRDVDRRVRRLVAQPRRSLTDQIALERAVALRQQIRDILEAAGYDRLILAHTTRALEQAVRLTAASRFARRPVAVLDGLRRIASSDLLAQGDEMALGLWRAVLQGTFSSRPVSVIVAELAEVLDDSLAQAQTAFDTQVAILTRHVEGLQTEVLGGSQPFLYVGPVDLSTREFCLTWVGRVLPRRDIEALDNGQLPNPFLTGGGYNCRHTWLAVESAELRALAGTDQRVSPIGSDVDRVRRLLADRRAARRRRTT